MYSLEDGGQALPTVRDFGGENPREVHKFSTEIIADSAVDFLKKQNRRSDPFMMYVSFTVPHDPWMPPPEYADLYPEESIPVPQNFMPRPMNNGEPFDYYSEWHGNNLRDELKMAYPRTPDGVRDVRRRYYGTITHTDHQVGRILKQLKKSGLDDNTLVVFTSDHGISLGAHGISGKQTMYEEGIRIPFIMRAPNMQRRSAKNDALVSLMDIYPTFCEAAGAEIPQEVEGTSLLPLYTGDAYQQRDEIFASFYPNYHQLNMRAIRTKEHKLVYHITTNEIELYDINRDPYELHNLADKEAYNQIKKELLDRLLAWRQQGDNNLK
jgi:arylsulfatase A-like enzyme